MTPAQCEAYAAEYKSLAQQSGITEGRAAMLKNVARTFTGLASQLDETRSPYQRSSKVAPAALQSRAECGARLCTIHTSRVRKLLAPSFLSTTGDLAGHRRAGAERPPVDEERYLIAQL